MTERVPRRRIQWPLLAIVGAAAGLIAVRMRWPRLLFDTTSLILFAIAAVAWALAFVPIKKLKWGDFEAELEPLVAAFGQQVIAAEAAPSAGRLEPRPEVVYRGGVGPADSASGPPANIALREFEQIVGSAAADREKIVRVAELVERISAERRLEPVTQKAVGGMLMLGELVRGGAVHPSPDSTVRILYHARRLLRTMTR